jgi:hypothetical protein
VRQRRWAAGTCWGLLGPAGACWDLCCCAAAGWSRVPAWTSGWALLQLCRLLLLLLGLRCPALWRGPLPAAAVPSLMWAAALGGCSASGLFELCSSSPSVCSGQSPTSHRLGATTAAQFTHRPHQPTPPTSPTTSYHHPLATDPINRVLRRPHRRPALRAAGC